MTGTSRFYINGKGMDGPSGSTVLDALAIVQPDEAAAVRRGERMITDSRGLPTETSTPIYNGAIFRIIRARNDNEDTSEL